MLEGAHKRLPVGVVAGILGQDDAAQHLGAQRIELLLVELQLTGLRKREGTDIARPKLLSHDSLIADAAGLTGDGSAV